jgi:Predicted nucleotidyltransferases
VLYCAYCGSKSGRIQENHPIMIDHKLQQIIPAILEWGRLREEITGVALTGSYARGEAREDSDIDLLIFAENPKTFGQTGWIKDINWNKINLEFRSSNDGFYGNNQFIQFLFTSGLEIEFIFPDREWLNDAPLKPETIYILKKGFVILYDRGQKLKQLQQKLNPNCPKDLKSFAIPYRIREL